MVLLAAVLFALQTFPGSCLDWPVRRVVLTATFGEDRTDHFHNGIDLGGGEQDVLSVLPGELVFRYDEGEDYTSIPRGVGSFLALHHGDGIRSISCHLKRRSLGAVRAGYRAGEKIGVVGDTGYSEGVHLHFAVFDSETHSFLNPLTLLPPLADSQRPVIRRIALAYGDRVLALEQGAIVPPGRVKVLAELADPRADVRFFWPMAPHSVRLSLDGREAAKISFDALHVVDGRTVLRGTAAAAADVYGAEGMTVCGTVDLRSGTSNILLTARDFAGNEATLALAFTVRQ
jgi:hypothetical protein